MNDTAFHLFLQSLKVPPYDKKHFFIDEKELCERGFAILGAGFHTREVVLPALKNANLMPLCILDSDQSKHGMKLMDIPIVHVSEFAQYQDKIVLISGGNLKSMIATCESFNHHHWIVPSAMREYCWTAGELGLYVPELQARNDIASTYAMWADDLSKDTFLATLKYHCFFDESLFALQERETYFPPSLQEEIDYSCLIDAGAYNGDTLRAWHDLCFDPSWTKFMYAAFEPSKEACAEITHYANQHTTIKKYVTAYNMALGKTSGQIYLSGANTPSAVTLNEPRTKEDCYAVPIVTIDSMNFDCVTCIKADVESFELDLLNGAIETIKKHRPALLISSYHRTYDVFDIPHFIDALNLDYRFYLRHHLETFGDTVCYMIPSK